MSPLPNRSSIATFDGAGKVNYQNLPPTDDTLDWDNPSLARAIGDVAALGQVSPRFWCRVVLAATTGGMSIPTWQAVWGNVTATAPIPGHVSTGSFTITLPTQVSTEYGNSVGLMNNITVNLLAASGSLEGSATPGFVNCSASGNVITINTFNAAGSANNLAGVTALILAY